MPEIQILSEILIFKCWQPTANNLKRNRLKKEKEREEKKKGKEARSTCL
jgi:hypothetical protein